MSGYLGEFPQREERSPFLLASGLAQRLATGLGVAPRFATAHVNLSNAAHRGVYKSFARSWTCAASSSTCGPTSRVDDQRLLRACVRQRQSLMGDFLDILNDGEPSPAVLEAAREFVRLCETHGRTAAQHDQFVARFIEHPAQRLPKPFLRQNTASGPPLPVLLDSLQVLRDKRMAADRHDVPTRPPSSRVRGRRLTPQVFRRPIRPYPPVPTPNAVAGTG